MRRAWGCLGQQSRVTVWLVVAAQRCRKVGIPGNGWRLEKFRASHPKLICNAVGILCSSCLEHRKCLFMAVHRAPLALGAQICRLPFWTYRLEMQHRASFYTAVWYLGCSLFVVMPSLMVKTACVLFLDFVEVARRGHLSGV